MYSYNPIFTSEEIGIERQSFIQDDKSNKGQSQGFDLGPIVFKAVVIVAMPFSISTTGWSSECSVGSFCCPTTKGRNLPPHPMINVRRNVE